MTSDEIVQLMTLPVERRDEILIKAIDLIYDIYNQETQDHYDTKRGGCSCHPEWEYKGECISDRVQLSAAEFWKEIQLELWS